MIFKGSFGDSPRQGGESFVEYARTMEGAVSEHAGEPVIVGRSIGYYEEIGHSITHDRRVWGVSVERGYNLGILPNEGNVRSTEEGLLIPTDGEVFISWMTRGAHSDPSSKPTHYPSSTTPLGVDWAKSEVKAQKGKNIMLSPIKEAKDPRNSRVVQGRVEVPFEVTGIERNDWQQRWEDAPEAFLEYAVVMGEEAVFRALNPGERQSSIMKRILKGDHTALLDATVPAKIKRTAAKIERDNIEANQQRADEASMAAANLGGMDW